MSQIDELLQQMTIEEKITMLAGADLWHSVAVPRLGVPQFRVTDGPNGARGSWGSMGPSSVATPVGIATLDMSLSLRIGLARQCAGHSHCAAMSPRAPCAGVRLM